MSGDVQGPRGAQIGIHVSEISHGRGLVKVSIDGERVLSQDFPFTALALAFVEDYARSMREAIEKQSVALLLRRGRGAGDGVA